MIMHERRRPDDAGLWERGMSVTSRRMKIIGVICGIICVGTASTLCLKAYMDASLASNGYDAARYQDNPVVIVENPTEAPPGPGGAREGVFPEKDGAQDDDDGDGPIQTIDEAMAGMAKLLAEYPIREQAKAREEAEGTSVTKEPDEQKAVLASEDSEEELLARLLSEREGYMEYLGDIELQVKRIYSNMEGTSIKEKQEAQDYAYRIWDDELNRIYPPLKRSLPEDEGEALKQEELQWIKDRDAKAQRDSASASSESSRLLSYTRSLTDTTRERTYVLVEWYFEENGSE